jgi:hypothetical protein
MAHLRAAGLGWLGQSGRLARREPQWPRGDGPGWLAPGCCCTCGCVRRAVLHLQVRECPREGGREGGVLVNLCTVLPGVFLIIFSTLCSVRAALANALAARPIAWHWCVRCVLPSSPAGVHARCAACHRPPVWPDDLQLLGFVRGVPNITFVPAPSVCCALCQLLMPYIPAGRHTCCAAARAPCGLLTAAVGVGPPGRGLRASATALCFGMQGRATVHACFTCGCARRLRC